MKHYVCVGDCGGESKQPGVCKAENCTHTGEALVSCECEDGSHENVLFGGKGAEEDGAEWNDDSEEG